MARSIKICVVNEEGYGVSGQRVEEYHGASVKTNSEGYATLLLEGSKTTIYINGRHAYDGFVSNLSSVETFTTSGEKP